MHPAKALKASSLAALPLLFAAAIVGACGGSDGGSTPVTSSANATVNEDDGSGTVGAGAKTGIVTIGDETFEFAMSTACVAYDGSIGAVGFTKDSQVSVDLDLPPPDWETSTGWHPPSIRVKDKRGPDERDWNAGNDKFTDSPTDYPGIEGKSQVDTYAIDGAKAHGTATFVDLNAYLAWQGGTSTEPEPVLGTFEVDCS